MAEAIDVINTWRDVLVKGQSDQLDRFLDEVGRQFQRSGWSRDTALEGKMNRDPDQLSRFYCWVDRPGREPRLMLCLNRKTERRIRGGTYSLIDDRTGASVKEVAAVVQQVLADVIEPAAAAVGLSADYPRFGPISRVGPRTDMALRAFAEAADGRWPLTEALVSAWRRFVVTAYQDDVAFEPGELARWFKANGWDADAAAELTGRFFADVALLDEYDEERAGTA